jgi:hypothetical protein
VREAIARLLQRPAPVLVALIDIQWICALAFALTVRHNGWLYGWRRYQGGDDVAYHSLAWIIGGGHLPYAPIGFAWSFVLAPLAAVGGPLLVHALPGVVLFQAMVVAPIGTLCMYGIAERIAGRVFAFWAALLWVVIPFAAIPFFVPAYHGQYVEQLLPHVFGLMYQGDFPSMIAVLVSVYFLVRALDTAAITDAALAGLAAGFAVGVKPANLLFLPAPFAALLVGRRWRETVPFAIALVPALVTLVIWKQRGLGYLPAFAAPSVASAGSVDLHVPLGAATDPLSRYVRIDLHKLHENAVQLREYFYSVPLLEWTPIAGLIAVARRSAPIAVLLGTWLGLYVFVKGSSDSATVYYSGTFFRLLLPAFPAYLLLAAAVPLLVPALGRRVDSVRARRLGRRTQVAAAVVALALTVPALVLAATLPRAPADKLAYYPPENNFVPISKELTVTPTRRGNAVVLRWSRTDAKGLRTRFRILRSPASQDCDPSDRRKCVLSMKDLGWTRRTAWQVKGPPGRWTFRVALAADWLDDPSAGMILLSPPVDVTVPG